MLPSVPVCAVHGDGRRGCYAPGRDLSSPILEVREGVQSSEIMILLIVSYLGFQKTSDPGDIRFDYQQTKKCFFSTSSRICNSAKSLCRL